MLRRELNAVHTKLDIDLDANERLLDALESLCLEAAEAKAERVKLEEKKAVPGRRDLGRDHC